jgi:small subunit ribosomal protein S6
VNSERGEWMNTYETIFIARPSLSDGEVAKLMDKIQGIIGKKGGTVLKAENWGKKKLAYEVKTEKRGTYLLFFLKGNGELIRDLNHLSRVDDALIRFLAVKSFSGENPPGRPLSATVSSVEDIGDEG